MELIPILSTIILVATICTFILAIGAYILYKMREKKGEQVVYEAPATVRAELVTPEELDYSKEEYVKNEKRETQPKPVQKPGVYPGGKESAKVRSRFYPTSEEEMPGKVGIRAEKTTGKKFLKYTSEGYIPTEEDKNSGVLKWR
jgi:hypothetical protein